LEAADIRFADEKQVIDWANSLLTSHGWEPLGERLWMEGRLRNGGRVMIVVPPLATKGPSVAIRKFFSTVFSFSQLIEWGCISQSIVDFLRVVMQARLNLIVAGGSDSGKTTLTNMVVSLIPEQERLIAVERANQLRIERRRLVYLEAEAASVRRGDATTMSDLLRLASRMRPDRIIAGELRGGEALEVLRLMNTGAEGMVALIHADSPRDALARLERMVTTAAPSLASPVIRAEIASALDLIVQVNRLEDGSRRVTSIVEIQDLKGDDIVFQELFSWQKTGLGEAGRFTGDFRPTGAMPSFAPELKAIGLSLPESMR
jgi:pilus assembly protein CpaF